MPPVTNPSEWLRIRRNRRALGCALIALGVAALLIAWML